MIETLRSVASMSSTGGPSRHGIVGQSRSLSDVMRRIELVADTRSTVLITGETGTGKELVARAVHFGSDRRDMPFVKVNCAAIPESLVESELFGHLRGAFTDATVSKKGKFSLANRGSIFLDEIGSMSLGLQAKLLRVLQEREIEPLGAERPEHVDVRVMAATNRDLRQLVAEGRFQDDLFYRLNVIPIVMPPLRERLDDIPALVDHFVRKHASRNGKPLATLEDGVIGVLQAHDWPGNVRELENTIERAVVLAVDGIITRDAVMFEPVARAGSVGTNSLKLRQNLAWMEYDTIRRALAQSPAKHQAARLMGISPRALSHYLAKYPDIDPRGLHRGRSVDRQPESL